MAIRRVTSLGHQGGQFFKLCPIVLNYVQHIFPGGAGEKFSNAPHPPGYGTELTMTVLLHLVTHQ